MCSGLSRSAFAIVSLDTLEETQFLKTEKKRFVVVVVV